MASTILIRNTTISPIHHHDRCHSHNTMVQSGPAAATCRFVSSRKKFSHHPLRTARRPTVRLNAAAAVGFETETSSRRSSFYDLLEVNKEVSFEEVKRAYRKLALRYHPDVSPPHLVEENACKFMEVQEAYQTLSDPRSREVYDRGLHLGFVSATTSARWSQTQNEFTQEVYDRSGWKRQWQDQLETLKRRSMTRDLYSEVSSGLSWGAKMRQR